MVRVWSLVYENRMLFICTFQIWFQNRRMKDKRQKLVMSWAATAPLHAWSLALQARAVPLPLHYYASWELHRVAASASSDYSPRLIVDEYSLHSRRCSTGDGFNVVNEQLPPPLPREHDVTSGSRDRVKTTLFRPYNLS